HRTTYYLYRECLPTAPLPESHRALILRGLSALQQQRPRPNTASSSIPLLRERSSSPPTTLTSRGRRDRRGFVTVERQRKCAGSLCKTAASLSFFIGLPFDTNPLRRPRPKIFTTSSEIL